MNNVIAFIAAPAADVDRIAKEIAREHIALQDCERRLEDAENRTEGLRQEQARRRVELGRLLIEAKRGIKHGGWLPYLEKLGISQQNAHRWMELAGFVDGKSRTEGNVRDLNSAPTLAEAGIDKRPRKTDSSPSDAFELAAAQMRKSIRKIAKRCSLEQRREVAMALRTLADEIEDGDL